MPTVRALEPIPHQPSRRRVVLSDGEAIELSLEVILAADLVPDKTVSPSALAEAQRTDSLKQAEHDALAMLGRKALSVAELKAKLAANGYDQETIDRVIIQCREWGYLDDRRLAEAVIAEGVELKHHGPMRIRQRLRARKIDPDLVEQAERKLAPGQPPLLEQALAALKTKERAYARLTPEVARRRMTAFLQRRGFDFDTIREAMRRFGRALDEAEASTGGDQSGGEDA